jgi:hypothetical protein
MKTIQFTGKKPSKAQILKQVKTAISNGVTQIEVTWGENWFTLEKTGSRAPLGPWLGNGWIKDIGADSIACELNKDEFVKNHFVFVRIN